MLQSKAVVPALMGLTIVAVLILGALPVTSAQAAVSAAPRAQVTPTPTGPVSGGPPLSLTLTLLFTLCSLGAVVGLLVVGFILSMQRQKGNKPDKPA
ncbi:MAG: hypothetical protein ACXWNQ_00945 [Anaerolineales bacterium]